VQTFWSAVGLLAPQGQVDKALNTIVNNLSHPITSTADRSALPRTADQQLGNVFYRARSAEPGLIDVVPDEATLGRC